MQQAILSSFDLGGSSHSELDSSDENAVFREIAKSFKDRINNEESGSYAVIYTAESFGRNDSVAIKKTNERGLNLSDQNSRKLLNKSFRDVQSVFVGGSGIDASNMPSLASLLRYRSSSIVTITNDLLDYLRQNHEIDNSEKIVSRIRQLMKYASEEGADQERLNIASLQGFISFLEDSKNLIKPSIVLSYAGNLSIRWTEEKNKRIVMEFLPTGDIRFVIFAPYKDNLKKTTRTSGITNLDDLLQDIRGRGLNSMIFHNDEYDLLFSQRTGLGYSHLLLAGKK